MINSVIFISTYIWYNIIRDILLLFEQFFYVSILSGLLPGTIMFMDWLIGNG